jgi:hypothetical protein
MVGEGEARDMTTAGVRRLYVAALWCGLAAALLVTLVPPSIGRYTADRRGFLNLVTEPTTAGKVWGRIQWVLSYLGPLLLLVSFSLQLVAVKNSTPSDQN